MASIPRSDCLDIAVPVRGLVHAAPGPRRQHRWLVPVLAVGLAVSTLWAAGASYCLGFHDDILTDLIARQRAQQIAFDNRVEALQAERAADGRPSLDDFDRRLSMLTERQALIERRQEILSGFGRDTPSSPSVTGALPSAPEQTSPRDAASVVPELGSPLGLRMRGGDRTEIASRRLAGLEDRLDRLSEHQTRTLSGVVTRASRNVTRLRTAIQLAGLDPVRFEGAERGIGGPLVPVSGDAFAVALAQAHHSAEDERRLARAVSALPFRRPLAEEAVYTSGFGTRFDPFTHGLALHTGLDLRADHGTLARATAPGRVTAAEFAGGYGNMVEIDHGHGIVTRYAHLAGFTVAPGQQIAAGAIVGRIGSTGRSTGTHLHYETRIDGEPVDPLRFLRAGEALAADNRIAAAQDDIAGDGPLGESWRAWTERQLRALGRR